MNKPDREPDFVIYQWQFYWKEMLQYNENERHTYRLVIIDNILFFIDRKGELTRYSYADYEQPINNAYKKWLISKTLKDKLKE